MSFRTFANTPADQFAGAMYGEDAPPGSIQILAKGGDKPRVAVQQKDSFGTIFLTDPKDLRSLGRVLMTVADDWESGKLGIPVPTDKGGG